MKEENIKLGGPSIFGLPVVSSFLGLEPAKQIGPIRARFRLHQGSEIIVPMTDEAARGLAKSLKELGY
jgi:hypothetical protein